MKEINKRIFTGLFLIVLLCLSFIYPFILIISLIIITIISWIEFNGLISKIFNKNIFKINFLRFFFKLISLVYLTLFSYLIFKGIMKIDFSFIVLYLFLICIFSDMGGFIFGKIFKGKKLTKISPNKTISGALGSLIFSSSFIMTIMYFLTKSIDLNIILIGCIISISCQTGDLFFSFLKRKSMLKDTGNFLPGHGGILDRVDGILFGIPVGFLTFLIFY